VKTIETRGQRTHHRGPLAIHAGLHRPIEGEDVGDWWWCWDVDQGAIVRQSKWAQYPAPLGAIVGVVNVVECLPIVHMGEECAVRRIEGVDVGSLWLSDPDPEDAPGEGDTSDIIGQLRYGDFTPGRWAWMVADVRPLPEPIPCRGAQGLWTVPDDIDAQLRGAAAA
jgi:hypothetical protein